uniref:FecR family protein n=1 Tax=Pedobacter schmidteae TaxID=2201271 RepID=UPI000EAE1E47|nr:FecR family protein [Pedobacter schmidteae]
MKEAEHLIEKYKAGLCSPEEELLLQKWFHHLDEEEISELTPADLNTAIQKFEDNIRGTILPSRTYKLWPGIAAAAAIIIVIGASLFLYQQQTNRSTPAVNQSEIVPGTEGATLTLANGKKIRLSDATTGELAKQGGVSISKTADGQVVYEIGSAADNGQINPTYNTLSTARGETYQVRLPDGSLVALNAETSLKYPASFASQKERRVELKGEAYFEVAKDKAHPFLVVSAEQEIEVLGTHFNVSAYPDDQGTKTTLIEGSVNVDQRDQKRVWTQNRILKPGQQSVMLGHRIDLRTDVDTESVIAWKNGQFVFVNEPIEQIMQKIARWYDVQVIYEGDMSNKAFVGTISRSKPISKVLSMIESTNTVHFKIKGRSVIVMD